jgi:signal transduction histidine kinase
MAHRAVEALAIAEAGPLDLVLLDVVLPDSDGFALLAQMRALHPDIIAVMVTDYATAETAIRAMHEGAAAYATKPYSMDELLPILRRSMESQRLARENRRLRIRAEQAQQELREATAQLVHRAKMAALGELTAGVAHELAQPLNSLQIICQSSLRYQKAALTPALRNDLKEMLGLVRHMSAIIDDMRVFSRRVGGEENITLDLNRVVRSALRLCQQQLNAHGVELATELQEGVLPILGNSARLQQVLWNLLSNARRAVQDAPTEQRKIVVRTLAPVALEDTDLATVEVADNGVGIPPELLATIFEPFVTTRPSGEGTGLGLPIARRIVEEHGGRVEVESRVGFGTVVRVTLPIAPHAAFSLPPRSSPQPSSRRG